MDNIIALESDVRNAFVRRNHLVSVFFDIDKAYDRTWRYGILRDLYNNNFRGHLPIFIANFLSLREFQVRIGTILSDVYIQEEGVPQGSVLSVTLFSLKINGILKCLPPSIRGNLYVDDLQISCQSKDMRYIERQLQIAISRMMTWCSENGFTFSADKTSCVHFCKRRGLHPEPEIYLGNSAIPVADVVRFLGVLFDKKLTFLPHVMYLRRKSQQALNLLKVLSNTSWGAERSTMLRVYRSVIRSKMDYGCSVYGSARCSVLRKLDTIHHSALRICSGAFRTSPIKSLNVICGEPSLPSIRKQLSLQLYFRILSQPHHPLHAVLLDSQFDRLFENRPSCIPPFGLRMRTLISLTSLCNVDVMLRPTLPFAPWCNHMISYLRPFQGFVKSNTDPVVYRQLFASHVASYPNYVGVYTDGSKTSDHVGCAYVCGRDVGSYTLPDCLSVFSAEFVAVHEALKYIFRQRCRRFIVYTDSISVLETLENGEVSHSHSLLSPVVDLHRRLCRRGFSVLELSVLPPVR